MKNKKLVSFLYILMRDHLPSGAVEGIMENHVKKIDKKKPVFTNEHLKAHAVELAERLLPDQEEEK